MGFRFWKNVYIGLVKAIWLHNHNHNHNHNPNPNPNPNPNSVRTLKLCSIVLATVVLQSCSTAPVDPVGSSPSGQTADRLFVLIGQADAAYQQNQWEDASQLYQEVLSIVPEDPYAWFRLGNSLTQTGQYYKAIFAYETSLKHDSLQTKPWFNLSTAHLLGAQLATMKALDSLSVNTVARNDMQVRLNTLSALLQ